MALTSGPNLGLLANGNQGEQHYTELMRFLRGVDGLVFLAVKSRTLNTPPASPADGDRYIVAAAPTGAWSGRANSIARYSSIAGTWEFFSPKIGWLAYCEADDSYYKSTGSGWELHRGPAQTYSTPTGTTTRATFDTATATATDVAQRLAALITDLKAQGILK